jgi:hypothetical protein
MPHDGGNAPAPYTISELRCRAELLRKLAKEYSDDPAVRRLTSLAAKMDARAAEIERSGQS